MAAVDPTTHSVNSDLFDDSQIDGVTYLPGSGLIRYVYGGDSDGFADWNRKITQFHIEGGAGTVNTPFAEEIRTASRTVEFCLRCDAQRYHLMVNGVLTNTNGYTDLPGDGAYRYVMFDTGDYTEKRLRLISNGGQPYFGPVRSETGFPLLDPSAERPSNMAAFVDSYGEPSFAVVDGVIQGVWGKVVLLAELLGVDNVVPMASGGTGLVNRVTSPGTAPATDPVVRCNMAERVADDLELVPTHDPQFDAIALFLSGNDLTGNYTQRIDRGDPETFAEAFQANAEFWLATARARWPNALIIVVSHANRAGSSAPDLAFKEGVLETLCATYGAKWVPGLPAAIDAQGEPWRAARWFGDGHPNALGHAGLPELENTLIRAALDPWTTA